MMFVTEFSHWGRCRVERLFFSTSCRFTLSVRSSFSQGRLHCTSEIHFPQKVITFHSHHDIKRRVVFYIYIFVF